VNSVLNALPMPEMHMRLPKGVLSEDVPGGSFRNTGKYSCCGPFTKLNKRLTEGYRGVNQLDRACFDHGVAYAAHKDTASRNHGHDVVAAAASKIALSDDAPEYEKKVAMDTCSYHVSEVSIGAGCWPRQALVPC